VNWIARERERERDRSTVSECAFVCHKNN
jgi:hypothetical protein